MWIPKEQNSTLLFKTSVCIVNNASTGCQADLVEVLSAVNPCCIVIAFYLEYIKPSQLQLIIELRNGTHILLLHSAKLRKSNNE